MAVAVTIGVALLGGCTTRTAPDWRLPSPAAAAPTSAPPSGAPAPSTTTVPVVPSGVVVGYAVYDRQSRTTTLQQDATRRFRSASLVKLLLALDYLWNRGPGYAVPTADRTKLDIMLRSSDDNAASYFYQNAGREQSVTRMITRLGLSHTAAPPAGRGWGTAAFSATDTVRIYRYLLDEAPAPVRDLIMGDLHQSTKCGSDHFDQSFGIPAAFGRPWSAKQGWYGFGDVPAKPCTAPAAWPAPAPAPDDLAIGPVVLPLLAPDVDVAGAVLHTTGTVGADDRIIIAVLTRHPVGTTFDRAAATVTALTRALQVPVGAPSST